MEVLLEDGFEFTKSQAAFFLFVKVSKRLVYHRFELILTGRVSVGLVLHDLTEHAEEILPRDKSIRFDIIQPEEGAILDSAVAVANPNHYLEKTCKVDLCRILRSW